MQRNIKLAFLVLILPGFLVILYFNTQNVKELIIDYRKSQILEEKKIEFKPNIQKIAKNVIETRNNFNSLLKSSIKQIANGLKNDSVSDQKNFMKERFNTRNSILKSNCYDYFESTGKSRQINYKPSYRFAATNLAKNKWIACIQPKSGTTNWQKLLLKSSGNEKFTNFEGAASENHKFFNQLDKLSSYNKDKREGIINTSESTIKFMHVRNPFDRLYSAWHQKFNTSFTNFKPYKKYVSEMKIEYTTPTGMACSFADFVNYYLSHSESNFHWRSIFWQCQPCRINYDFISKQETFHEDSDYIIKQVFGDNNGFTVEHAYKKPTSETSKIRTYSELAWLPDDLHRKLEKHFYWEMKILGYEYPNKINLK